MIRLQNGLAVASELPSEETTAQNGMAGPTIVKRCSAEREGNVDSTHHNDRKMIFPRPAAQHAQHTPGSRIFVLVTLHTI